MATVAALLAGGTAAAEATRSPAAPAPQPTAIRVPVDATALVCPDLGGGTAVGTDLTVGAGAAVTGVPGGDTAVEVRLGLGPDGTLLSRLNAEGVASARVPAGGIATVRASGPAASTIAAVAASSVPDGLEAGRTAGTCATVGTSFWFVGSGGAPGQRGVLTLANPEQAPAVVDVSAYGPVGPLDTQGVKALTVPAGRSVALRLDGFASGAERLGLAVVARTGRVAALLRDSRRAGLAARGVDLVPPAVAPARSLVIPAVPGGPGARLLHVVSPGGADAVVQVRLLRPADSPPPGPERAQVLTVSAGSVGTLDLTSSAGGQPVAMELRSDVPVTAAVQATTASGAAGTADLAWTAATGPLSGVLEVPVPAGDPGGSLLVSGAASTTVTLEPVGPGPLAPRSLAVPAGRTAVIELPPATDARPYAVQLAVPEGAQVWAGRAVAEAGGAGGAGARLALTPVQPPRPPLLRRPVIADPTAALR